MNVKAIRQNALARLEASASKRKPEMRGKGDVVGKKQTTALQLLQREEQNARRSRMESLLTQQFIGKYGSKQPSSRINSFIKATVVDFINSYDNMAVAESMVESLEAQVREITANMKKDINQVRKESRQNTELEKLRQAKEQVEARKRGSRSGSFKGSSGNGNHGVEALSLNQNGDLEPSWAVLNAIRATEAEKKEEEKKKALFARSTKYKHDLDAQRDFLRSMRDTGEKDKVEQHALNMKAAAEHKAEQERQKEKKLQHHASERVMRLRQIEENEQGREKEKQLKIMQEKADMARSRRLADQEALAMSEKKERGRLAVERVKEENEANKLIKEAARIKQWEYEAKLNKDYEAKLAREEEARETAFKNRVDALKKFEKGFEGVAQAAQAKNDSEMSKTMASMEAKYEADAQKLKDKADQRKSDMQKSREFNMTLIEKKKKIKEDEKRMDYERRILQQKQLENENEVNRKKKADKHEQMSKLKKQLDEQVHQRETENKFFKTAGLSSLEKELNGSIIQKIKSDPTLFKKVMNKVNPTPRGGVGEFKYG